MVGASVLCAILAYSAFANGQPFRTTVSGIDNDPKKPEPEPERLPGAYIVEFEEGYESDAFVDDIADLASTRRRLESRQRLFRGASIQFHDVERAEKLASDIGQDDRIKNVWPVISYPIPWMETYGKTNDSDGWLSRRSEMDIVSPHAMSQVDLLFKEGVTGKGMKIAVIDSGIDYLHPALGGCIGDGCLVTHGHDFVGNDYTGPGTVIKPTNDPMDCFGHGTHVAGIIAAQDGNGHGIRGVAPGVTLGAYKVFGCSGGVGNDILIESFLKAYDDGSDIITASIGGLSGWSQDPWAVVIDRIVDAGVPCLVAAGNSGASGPFQPGNSAKGAISIASVDNTHVPSWVVNGSYAIGDLEEEIFQWSPQTNKTWADVHLPIWLADLYGCIRYPDDTPDLTNRIVLVERGICTFEEKAQLAAEHGARYMLVYNTAAGVGPIDHFDVDGFIATGMITKELSDVWKAALENGTTVTVTVKDSSAYKPVFVNPINTLSGGFVSLYSSWGPTWELDVKPQVSAPGGVILSTMPRSQGLYSVQSGTSMAAPYAAGVVALVASVRKTLDPKTLTNVLAATANANLFHDGFELFSNILAPVPQQGGGLIQAYDAAHVTTLLNASRILFKDTVVIRPQTFSIQNLGSSPVSFKLGSVSAATVDSFNDQAGMKAGFPRQIVDASASLSFSEDSVTIAPGGTASVEVSATPPVNVNGRRMPIYSGYITLNGTNGENLSLPYMGVATDMSSIHGVVGSVLVTDQTESPAHILLPEPGTADLDNDFFSLPSIGIVQILGSPLIRVDLEPVGENSDRVWNRTTTVLGQRTLGNINGFPQKYNPGIPTQAWWDGKLENGRFAPSGSYRFVARSLRLFGDPEDAEMYTTTATEPFTIEYNTTCKV